MINISNLQVQLFLFSFFLAVNCKKHCPTSYCGSDNSLPIRDPFKLQDQEPYDQNCSYTNLTCTSQGIPVLNLPYSGDFFVRYVDYYYSIIQLYDPDNCLPKRLMSLNLSSWYPFQPISYDNYTLYSCPSDLIRVSNLTAIDCLSNSSTATVATLSVLRQVMETLYECNETSTFLIPTSRLDSYVTIANQTDFLLSWHLPPCKNCPRPTELVPSSIVDAAFILITFGTIIMPMFICIACCVDFIRLFRKEVKAESSNLT